MATGETVINSSLTCDSLNVSNDVNINGTLNGCNIATTGLTSLGTLPIIPVINSNSIMEVGRYLDLHYKNSDDYNARIECESKGEIKITNNSKAIAPLRVLSQNEASVQLQFGKRLEWTDGCAIIQYNVSGPTIGFGFWNKNNTMTLDTSGNLLTPGKITANNVNINDALDGKAALSHTHPISDIIDLQTTLDGKADSVHTHTSADITNWATATENFAKLSASNTFTGSNTFNKRIAINISGDEQALHMLRSSGNLTMVLGNDASTNNASTFKFVPSQSRLEIGFWNNDGIIKVGTDKNVSMSGALTVTGDVTAPNITAINTALNGKADAIHTHSISDITDLQTTLNGKAALSHTHPISDITDLQTTLNGKAASSHDHVCSDVTDIEAYVDNRISAKFNQLFSSIHPIGSIIMLQNALSTLGAIPIYEDNHLHYSWNDTTWEYLPDAAFIRNGTIDSSTHTEKGATLSTSGSDTHHHTTANHTLTKNEMPSHHHAIFCAETKDTQGNHQKVLSSDRYGGYGEWLYMTNYWDGTGDKPQPFIGVEGGDQAHNHGDTSTESNVPTHIVAYFYIRIS